MSHVKITDLSPAPFFARFLEGQFEHLTPEEMKLVRGGVGADTTMMAPSDSDLAEVRPPWEQPLTSLEDLIRHAQELWGHVPGMPTQPPSGPIPVEPDGRPA